MQSWEINKEQSNEITTLRQQLAEARKDTDVAKGQYQGACDIIRELEKQISGLQARLDARGEAYRIDYDEEMGRYYIPVHANWEIQTKGKGSSFRIANRKTGDRWLVGDSYLHDMLEQMARDIATTPQPTYLEGVADGLRRASEVCSGLNAGYSIPFECLTDAAELILAINPEEV